MDFGEVLSRAWNIIWKYKVLWIFGILAGCTSAAGSGGSNSGYRFTSETQNLPAPLQNLIFRLENLPQWEILLLVGLIILVFLVLFILFVVLGTVGRIGLIRGTQLADQGAERLTFSELWNESMHYFWRVLGLNLLVGLVLFVIFAILVIAYVFSGIVTLGIGFICLLPFFCILIPIAWFIQVIIEQANNALVLENLRIMDGVRRGWEVVKNNLGTMIIMALILILGVGLIGGLIIGLPFAIIILPALTGAFLGTQNAMNSGLLIAGLCLVAYIPVLLLLSGILRSYISAAWTLTYLRLTRQPAAPPALQPVTLPE